MGRRGAAGRGRQRQPISKQQQQAAAASRSTSSSSSQRPGLACRKLGAPSMSGVSFMFWQPGKWSDCSSKQQQRRGQARPGALRAARRRYRRQQAMRKPDHPHPSHLEDGVAQQHVAAARAHNLFSRHVWQWPRVGAGRDGWQLALPRLAPRLLRRALAPQRHWRGRGGRAGRGGGARRGGCGRLRRRLRLREKGRRRAAAAAAAAAAIWRGALLAGRSDQAAQR